MLLYALSAAVLRHGPYEVRLKGDRYSMRRQRGTTSTEMENSTKGGSQVPDIRVYPILEFQARPYHGAAH